MVKGKDPFSPRSCSGSATSPTTIPRIRTAISRVIARNAIAITPLHFDLTQGTMLKRMAGLFPAPRRRRSRAGDQAAPAQEGKAGVSLAARKIRLIMGLRRAGVTDSDVLNALERIPREAFVLPHFHDQAYEDQALPIAAGPDHQPAADRRDDDRGLAV